MINLNKKIEELVNRINYLEQENKANKIHIESHRQASDIQTALNEIMQVSMMPLNLYKIQQKILETILNIPWLSLEQKGCMFVVEETGILKMTAHHNLSESLLAMCNKVAFGRCLCGKAAQTKKMVFKSCLDHDHQNQPTGIKPHGHYNLPIKSRDGSVLGVLNLYVKHGHKSSNIEVIFLESVSKILAILIESKKLEEQLKKSALTDSLTGLANRQNFMDNLYKSIARAERNNKKLAILFLDLNKFKPVNDHYGHDVGDELLKKVSGRLLEVVRKGDLVARVGGDEFIILLENIKNSEDISLAKSKIAKKINSIFIIMKHEIEVGVSIGSAIYPDDGIKSETLIKLADQAMYMEKKNNLQGGSFL